MNFAPKILHIRILRDEETQRQSNQHRHRRHHRRRRHRGSQCLKHHLQTRIFCVQTGPWEVSRLT